jgi:hypothetical protein
MAECVTITTQYLQCRLEHLSLVFERFFLFPLLYAFITAFKKYQNNPPQVFSSINSTKASMLSHFLIQNLRRLFPAPPIFGIKNVLAVEKILWKIKKDYSQTLSRAHKKREATLNLSLNGIYFM